MVRTLHKVFHLSELSCETKSLKKDLHHFDICTKSLPTVIDRHLLVNSRMRERRRRIRSLLVQCEHQILNVRSLTSHSRCERSFTGWFFSNVSRKATVCLFTGKHIMDAPAITYSSVLLLSKIYNTSLLCKEQRLDKDFPHSLGAKCCSSFHIYRQLGSQIPSGKLQLD